MSTSPLSDRLEVERFASERKFVRFAAIIVVFAILLPALVAWVSAPAGATYLGYQYNTDDHMVYAAWMRQAMDGHLFFDNRFTTAPQPTLTVHLYFFALGLIAKITGIAVAAALGRVAFSVLFLFLLFRMIRRLNWEVYTNKLALALTVVGGGLGFLVWQAFGTDFSSPSPLSGVMLGHLPTDVWQPEGFVFPSMLTNGLFMVSLCLILVVFDAFLTVRTSKKALIPGFVAMALLMNIHSYDVLMVAMVMVGFLAASLLRRQVTGGWVGRAAIIALGAVPPALWFVHVLQNDPVFQSRAATETFSPNFRQVFFGYLPLMIPAFAGVVQRARGSETRNRRLTGLGLAALLFVGLFVAAAGHTRLDTYFLGMPAFLAVLVVAVVAVALGSDEDATWNLFFSWAVVGMVGIYFPGLFQRKLAMGLSIPWAILAAYGLYGALRSKDRSMRNLTLALSIVLLGASSVRWLARELSFIRMDVSNTGRHPVYLTADVEHILDYLNKQPGRKVVFALPGIGLPAVDATTNEPLPDSKTLLVPDLAPIVTGLTGSYTYAGHWSETPEYGKKFGEMYRFFFKAPYEPLGVRTVMTPEERTAFIAETGAQYAVLPTNQSYPEWPLLSATDVGEVVVRGNQFELVKLR